MNKLFIEPYPIVVFYRRDKAGRYFQHLHHDKLPPSLPLTDCCTFYIIDAWHLFIIALPSATRKRIACFQQKQKSI